MDLESNELLDLIEQSHPQPSNPREDFEDEANSTELNVTYFYENVTYLNLTNEVPINYAVPLYGYCVPFLFIVTIVANTLIVVVLSKRHMRTPTNAVLLAMALSDALTVIFPAPWLLYLYTFGNHYKPFYPIAACYLYTWMHEIIPNMFHTASIWLTLALAVQRYIYVCHAAMARTWCTMPRVLKAIFLIYLTAALHQSTRFFDRVYLTETIMWEGELHHVCKQQIAPWVHAVGLDLYFPIYFCFRVICIHMIPCVSLIVLNLLLLKAMREAQIKRQQLFKDNKKQNECRKLMDSYSTTLMLFVVVTVFLIVEIPLAVLTVLHIISSSIVEFLNYEVVNLLILFSNFLIIVSYPINFAIYCGMSRQFRKTFKDLFMRGAVTGGANGSARYCTGNGPRTYTNETVL